MKIVRLKEYVDPRGSLVENTLKEVMDQSEHFFVSKSKPGVVRGNHYHHHKSEWFYIIQGTCQLIVEDIHTKVREEKTIRDSDNLLIYMEPGKAHAFKNIGDNELILLALINEVLDRNNPDTFEYKVI